MWVKVRYISFIKHKLCHDFMHHILIITFWSSHFDQHNFHSFVFANPYWHLNTIIYVKPCGLIKPFRYCCFSINPIHNMYNSICIVLQNCNFICHIDGHIFFFHPYVWSAKTTCCCTIDVTNFVMVCTSLKIYIDRKESLYC